MLLRFKYSYVQKRDRFLSIFYTVEVFPHPLFSHFKCCQNIASWLIFWTLLYTVHSPLVLMCVDPVYETFMKGPSIFFVKKHNDHIHAINTLLI